MTENRDDPKPIGLKQRLAGGIGGALGAFAGLGVGKLFHFDSFWLGLLLFTGCVYIGIFLGQKIGGKYLSG